MELLSLAFSYQILPEHPGILQQNPLASLQLASCVWVLIPTALQPHQNLVILILAILLDIRQRHCV